MRKSQRIPKACTACTRRKIKCDKVIPCMACRERHEPHLCAREVVLVKGSIRNIDLANESNIPQHFINNMRRLDAENAELLSQVSSLQKIVLELRQQSRGSPPESSSFRPQGHNGLVSPANSNSQESPPEATPGSQIDNSGYTYATALQHIAVGIIEEKENDTNDPGVTPQQRARLDDTIPAFSRKPLNSKDNPPFCPSCSIGEMSNCFAARLPFDNGQTPKIFLSLAFELPLISREQSTVIVKYALECLNFLHCAVHPSSFYREHDFFWDSTQPKELNYKYDKNRGQYLWSSIWYAILCLGTFYADENLKQRLGMDKETLHIIPHMLFAASLECLHRGEVYKFPDIRSVQVFCILGPCFQAFSGINMRNCMLNTMVYISQRLNLDKIESEEKLNLVQRMDYGDADASTRFLDRELGRRIWWSVVNSDWLDNTGRNSIIHPTSFLTVLPGNFNDEALAEEVLDDKGNVTIPSPLPLEMFTVSSFHIYMAKLAAIKRKYYFEPEVKLNNLFVANEELKKLSESLPPQLRSSNRFVYGNHESQLLSLQRYLLHISTDFECLKINQMMAACIPKAKWNESCRHVCLKSARSLLVSCSLNVPITFKKHPMVSGNGIAAAVYILLDLLDSGSPAQITERLKWVDSFKEVLQELQHFHSQARRGISIITKLTSGVIFTAEERANPRKGRGRRKRRHEPSEPAPSVYDIFQRLSMMPRVSAVVHKPQGPTVISPGPGPGPGPSSDPYTTLSHNFRETSISAVKTEKINDLNSTAQYPTFPEIEREAQTEALFLQNVPSTSMPPHSEGRSNFYAQNPLVQDNFGIPQPNYMYDQPNALLSYQATEYHTSAPSLPYANPVPPDMFMPPLPPIDRNTIDPEELNLMALINNIDHDSLLVNMSNDFDYDLSLLSRPPPDCPDDV